MTDPGCNTAAADSQAVSHSCTSPSAERTVKHSCVYFRI